MSEAGSQRGGASQPIRSFTDLRVWQKAHDVSAKVFALTRSFPAEERFSLTDQIRRSARSVGANIAEAWGKRRYEAAFVAKLTDADGEANETEHWLIESASSGYLSSETEAALRSEVRAIGKMLGSMINRPGPFLTNR